MDRVQIAIPVRGFGETSRPDAWWVQPLAVFSALSAFIAYATWASYQGADYRSGPYLSPFYSPELYGDPEHALFGAKPGWWPLWLRFLARGSRHVGAGRLSDDLLLLPRRLLQGVLGRPAVVYRGRAAKQVSG